MTSPKKAAIELAQYGRAGDSTLMHVSTDEVKALRGYARSIGRDVTTNPDTGLPEAFSFGDIAKIAALAGATYLTGGALAPYTTAALGSTLGGVAANGLAGAGISKLANPELSTGQALTNGLGTAAIGAGIGGLGGKIAEFGAEPAAAAAAAGAETAGAAQTAGTAVDPFSIADPAARAAATPAGIDAFGSNAISPGSAPLGSTGPYNTFSQGLERGAQSPGQLAINLQKQGGLGDLGKIGLGASLIDLDSPDRGEEGGFGGEYSVYDVQGSPIIDRDGSKEDTYGRQRTVKFAEGRLVDPMGNYGDGVSDSVPAMIDGGQRADIASGEYIFPARAVSAAGNGSTMAGAKRLDAMSNDLIRQQHRAGLARAPKMNMDKAKKKAKI